MRDVLFLTHRLPYPPDKGDKIRGWHVLRHLASKHRVHLVGFIDDPDDVRHIDRLESMCASVVWRQLFPRTARIRSLRGLLSGAPLTEGYFGDRQLRMAVDRIAERYRPSLVYVFSSAMFPYVSHHRDARVIVDLVDVDSEKWREYSAESTGLKRFIYRREGRTLLALERQAAARAEAVLFVSHAEAQLFTSLAPEAMARTHAIRNGVNADYFSPALEFSDPFEGQAAIVFTGAMNYRPNIDAMVWFVEEVMPKLRGHLANPSLWIVGSSPTAEVMALACRDVRVTGRVPDVRPYLKHATVVVAPLRIARGIQNKVLEAMAMGVPLVLTPQAREGLDGCGPDELLMAVTPMTFADAVKVGLDGRLREMGTRARARVVQDFSWGAGLATLDRLIDGDVRVPASTGRMPELAEVKEWN